MQIVARPQDGDQSKNGSSLNDKVKSAQSRRCRANMIALHVHACAQVPGRQREERRSPSPAGRKTEIGQRIAHHSKRRSVYYATSAQHCCCRTNMVLSHVHVCAQGSYERLDDNPGLHRRPADAEKSLPTRTCQGKDLPHDSNIP